MDSYYSSFQERLEKVARAGLAQVIPASTSHTPGESKAVSPSEELTDDQTKLRALEGRFVNLARAFKATKSKQDQLEEIIIRNSSLKELKTPEHFKEFEHTLKLAYQQFDADKEIHKLLTQMNEMKQQYEADADTSQELYSTLQRNLIQREEEINRLKHKISKLGGSPNGIDSPLASKEPLPLEDIESALRTVADHENKELNMINLSPDHNTQMKLDCDLQMRLDQEVNSNLLLKERAKSLISENSKLVETIKTFEEEKRTDQLAIEEFRQQVNSLVEEMAEMTDESLKLRAQISKLSSEKPKNEDPHFQTAEQVRLESREKIAGLEFRLQQVQQKFNVMDENYSNLQAELVVKNKSITENLGKIEDLERELLNVRKDAQVMHDRQSNEIKRLISLNEELDSKQIKLVQSLNDNETKLARLQAVIQKKIKDNAALKDQLDQKEKNSASNAGGDLVEKLKKSVIENEILMSKNCKDYRKYEAELKAKIDEEVSKFNSLNSTVETLNRQLHSVTVETQEEIFRLKLKIKDLEEQILKQEEICNLLQLTNSGLEAKNYDMQKGMSRFLMANGEMANQIREQDCTIKSLQEMCKTYAQLNDMTDGDAITLKIQSEYKFLTSELEKSRENSKNLSDSLKNEKENFLKLQETYLDSTHQLINLEEKVKNLESKLGQEKAVQDRVQELHVLLDISTANLKKSERELQEVRNSFELTNGKNADLLLKIRSLEDQALNLQLLKKNQLSEEKISSDKILHFQNQILELNTQNEIIKLELIKLKEEKKENLNFNEAQNRSDKNNGVFDFESSNASFLKARIDELEELRRESIISSNEAEKGENELEELKKKLAEEQEKKTKSIQLLRNSKNRILKIEGELRSKDELVTKFTKDLEETTKLLNTKEGLLEQEQKINSILKAKIDEAQSKISEIQVVVKQVEPLKDALQFEKKRATEAEEHALCLQKKFSDDMKDRISELEKSCEKRIQDIKDASANSTQEIEQLRANLLKADANMNILELELASSKSLFESKCSENDQLKMLISENEVKFFEKDQETARVIEEKSVLQKEFKARLKSFKETKTLNEALRADLKDMELKLENALKKETQLQNELKDISESLKTFKNRNASNLPSSQNQVENCSEMERLKASLKSLELEKMSLESAKETLISDFRMREGQLKNINKALKEEVRRFNRPGSVTSSNVSSPALSRANSNEQIPQIPVPIPDPEYLKNVILKFIESTKKNQRVQLVGVLGMLLKFSPDELKFAQNKIL